MTADATSARSGARAALGLFIVGLGTLTAPLDSSVNIAFPAITRAFGVPLEDMQWVVICYVLIYSSLTLVFGKMGDLVGHRRIFGIGLFVSAIAFAFCGAADTFVELLLARALQGVGSALVISCGPALATMLFAESFRARALGIYTMAFGLGGVIGPSLGGVLIEEWGWSAVFWFRAPLAAVTLMLLFLLPRAQPRAGSRSFDIAGAALLVVGLSTFLLAINQARHVGAGEPVVPVLLGFAAVGCFAGFFWQQRRSPEPILHPKWFRNAAFTVVNVTNVMVNMVGFAVMFLVPFYLDRMTDLSLVTAGAVLAMSPAGMVLAGPVGGWLLGRVAAPRLAFAGAVLVGLGLLAIGQWGATTSIVVMVAGLATVGIGFGFFQVAYMEIVAAILPLRERGVAGSLAMVTRTIGVVSGATGLALAFTGFTPVGAGTTGADFLAPFATTLTAAGALLLVFLAVTLLRPRIWFAAAWRSSDSSH